MPPPSRKRRATDLDESVDLEYQKGSIVKIELENFMTYSKFSTSTGPYLNLIIGPNGTGKSAIVCGLIIGLAGNITNTGRSGIMSDYIKFGCNSATIKIELFNPRGRNHIIKRRLTRQNEDHCATDWMLDGQKVLMRDIKQLVESLNISVDNLCQCLPQERVVEFVKMNPKELLLKTQEAIGASELIDYFNILLRVGKEVVELKKQYSSLSGTTAEDEQIQQRCEEEVARMKERKQMQKDINLMKVKESWLTFYAARKKFDENKKILDLKKQSLEIQEQSYAPAKESIKKYRDKSRSITSRIQSLVEKKREIFDEMKEMRESLKETVSEENTLINEFEAAVAEEQQRVQKMKDLTSEILTLKNQLKAHESTDALEESRVEVKSELTTVSSDLREVESQLDAAERNRDCLSKQLRDATSLLERNSAIGRRKDLLRSRNDQAYRALRLLEENRVNFRREIHPPMMLSIDVKDAALVKFVEASIPGRDLFAFVCEDKEDLKNFGTLMRTNGLKVSIVMAPENHTQISTELPHHLRSYGFTHTVSSMFTAPDAIMQYLEQQCGISRIPVEVKANVQSPLDNRIDEIKNLRITRFFSSCASYRVASSRYDGASITTSDAIPEPSLLKILNTDDKRAHDDIQQFKSQLESLNQQISQLKESRDSLSIQKKELMRKDNLIKNKIEDRKNLIARIEVKQNELLKRKNSKWNMEEAKRTLFQEITAKRTIFQRKVAKLANKSTQLIECSSTYLSLLADRKALDTISETIESLINRASRNRERLKSSIRELQEIGDKLRNEAVQLKRNAVVISKEKNVQLTEDDRLTKSSESGLAKFPSDVFTLRGRLEALIMKESSLSGTVDEQVEADAARRLQSIANNKRQMNKLKSEIEQKEEILKSTKERWIGPLKELIERINDNFEKFMRHMGYAGQVALFEKEDRYEEYGINIKVKYRARDDLSDLTAFHQSGGERSVATVIYMLALQELSKVPFRCVDEINQGMDATNERKVFDLVVDTAIHNSSQYFLLSPKLLLDLTYNSKMHIHCIYNGPKLDADWACSL